MPTEITGACGATVCGTHGTPEAGTPRRVDTTVRCPPPPSGQAALRLVRHYAYPHVRYG